MKSNISLDEINSGKKIIDLLQEHNTLLSPHTLKKIIFDYKNFTPHIYQYGLWFSQKFTKKSNSKYDKIFFLLNGLAASGKDSIHSEMVKLTPKLFYKTVTGTSRVPRKGEVNGIDYHFYPNISEFQSDIRKNKFIEYLNRNGAYYGLPKKSIDNAIEQSNPIIYCQIEMSGWEKLEKYVFSLNKNILIIKSFVLPHMDIHQYLKWLTQNRGAEDVESRINKSGWELKTAPKKADFIVCNRISTNIPTLTYTAKTIINLLIPFIKNSNFKKFSTPTDNLDYTKNISKIVKIHDSIV
jgi:guanylate kinase